jgi:hypothetical protein
MDLQFRTITGNYLPLILELQKMQSESKLVTPRDLADLDANAWLELINKQIGNQVIGFPAETPGKDDVERAQNYAKMLLQAVEETFPMAAIVKEVERDSKPDTTYLRRFFANNPMFEFSKADIAGYLQENSDTALTGITDREGITAQLKTLQRVYKVTPRYGEMQTLLSEGINSAQDIARMDESTFTAKFAALFGESRAREIYQRATQMEILINEETLNLSIRKFLKLVGINSQRKIEQAITKAIQDGLIDGTETLLAKMTLEVKGLNLITTFDGEIKLQ